MGSCGKRFTWGCAGTSRQSKCDEKSHEVSRRRAADYADDYTSEGARVLTYRPKWFMLARLTFDLVLS